ncbi:TonB-dependent receptor domain-containing protein, partial [Sphingobium aquiterrae]|uniref:TonB-dependent receptor domain-containing protein n=1 Tax=Sphingobium aquiterrae TaxID=2038656 RepID=UPI003019C2A9
MNFSSPSADVAIGGNPALKPYLSKNIDLGVELYTGREGLIAASAFRKELTGFTTNGTTTIPFTDLAQYGITYDTLNPTQQAAINSRGGPNAATIIFQQQVNASGKLTVNGLEFQWVQPLDFLTERFGVKGFGLNANATIIDQKGSGAACGIVPVFVPTCLKRLQGALRYIWRRACAHSSLSHRFLRKTGSHFCARCSTLRRPVAAAGRPASSGYAPPSACAAVRSHAPPRHRASGDAPR